MIITLCGSARFEPFFKLWNEHLTLAGHVVFSLSVYPSDKAGEKGWYTENEKLMLDTVHKRKILASDAILVLNAFSYIGESTLSEISFAKIAEKKVYFMEQWSIDRGPDQRSIPERYNLVKPESPLFTNINQPDALSLLGDRRELKTRLIDAEEKLYEL